MYKKLLVCGLALLMCGCSTKAAGNDQVLTVGLSSEMNGTFSPMPLSSLSFRQLTRAWTLKKEEIFQTPVWIWF